MSKSSRATLALAAAAVALVAMAWFDTTVIRDAQQREASTFDLGQLYPLWSLGLLLVAGVTLVLAVLVWRTGSVVVGAIYIAAGSFFAFLPSILWTVAVETNGRPPALPESLATAVGNIYTTSTGPLNAVATIGAGMVIAGVAAIARSLRDRTAAAKADALPSATATPSLP